MKKKKSRSTIAGAAWPPPSPPDESEEARMLRQKEEEEAKRVSDDIDKNIGAEKERRKKSPNAKILLLGQAESGKSTVLKNFQLHFSPKAFEAEAEIWRPIIHLNLVRSINFILNFLSASYRGARDSTSHQPTYGTLSNEVRRLCARLAPLRQVEESLTKEIAGSTLPGLSDTPNYNPAKASEVAIRSSTGWRAILKVRRSEEALRSAGKLDDKDRRILAACSEDIISLWNDASVRKALKKHEIALQEQPGFFLEDVDRITRENYTPTPKDILRARVTTMGPEEHRIKVESATDSKHAKECIIYDVGGSRNQRAAWAQYFDDVNVIIFLAPVSSFNQVLAEDESVNRLTDTFKLWQMICANKLLAEVELILFLNKFDILAAKLKAGVDFAKYVPAYGSRPNEVKVVATFLVDIFIQIHKQNTTKRRKIHAHMTTAIDTKATASVIDRIHEVIMVKLLAHSNIL